MVVIVASLCSVLRTSDSDSDSLYSWRSNSAKLINRVCVLFVNPLPFLRFISFLISNLIPMQ